MSAPARIEVAQVVTRFIAGAGGVALRGAASLDPDAYHVTIVTGEGGPLLDEARDLGMDVHVEPSLVPQIAPRSDLTALRRLEALFGSSAFDVVHTHSAKAGAIGRVAAHRAGVPLVVHTYHGFPFHQFQSRARRAAYVEVERRLARITDVVLCIGTGIATEALRRGLATPTNLRTVAPAVDTVAVRLTQRSRSEARLRLSLPENVPVLGTVGRVEYQKAPEVFVEAVGLLRHTDTIGVWVGGGPDEEAIRRLAESRGLAERIALVGQRSDVTDILPAFDVFAMTSRYEGLPCAIVEAMRCGLPVVATAVNSVPDLVVPGETGILVPPEAPHQVAEAVDRLLEDPFLAARLADHGQQLADETYDPERLGVILDEVYGGGLRRPRLLRAV
jgi:glycosyltransferase involved in cell wall biosynthesis